MATTMEAPVYKVSSKSLTIAFFVNIFVMFGLIGINGFITMTASTHGPYPTNIWEAILSQPYIVGSMVSFMALGSVLLYRFYKET